MKKTIYSIVFLFGVLTGSAQVYLYDTTTIIITGQDTSNLTAIDTATAAAMISDTADILRAEWLVSINDTADILRAEWRSNISDSLIWSKTGNDIYYNTGVVGIGLTSPSYDLDIDAANGGINVVGGGGLVIADNTGNPQLKIVLDQQSDQNASIVNNWGNSGNSGIMLGTSQSNGIALQVNSAVPITSGLASGQGTTQFQVNGDGTIDLPDYGSGNNTGTETYKLSVDASGNLIEEEDWHDIAIQAVARTTEVAVDSSEAYFVVGREHDGLTCEYLEYKADTEAEGADEFTMHIRKNGTSQGSTTVTNTTATEWDISNFSISKGDVIDVNITAVSNAGIKGLTITIGCK